MRYLLARATNNPRQIFLIDALGALVSAFLLGVVLVHYEKIFGIPTNILYPLAIVPCFFALYDLICFYGVKKNLGSYLRFIAILNGCYCLLSLGLALSHKDSITIYGWLYILGEILIILLLAFFEYSLGNKIMVQDNP